MARTTLRDLMGLSGQPAPLRDTTLIMIDCQNTYQQGIMRLDGAEAALADAARLRAGPGTGHTRLRRGLQAAGLGR